MKTTSSPIVTGVLGFGRSGHGIHAKAISMLPDRYRLAAIYDALPERRQHEAFPEAKACATVEEVLANPEIEMVVVASPNKFHARHAIAALKAGKHVLCEKPIALDASQIDDLIATGGTAEAAVKLFTRAGGTVAAASFVIELPELGGRQRLEALDIEVLSLCAFEGH